MNTLTAFKNRIQAGQQLARQLSAYIRHPDAIVLALPRGGVPVGFAMTQSLQIPLDVLLVRKLGMPGHQEYAIGAVAGGGICLLNDEVVASYGISKPVIDAMIQQESQEIVRRETLYRANRPPLQLKNRIVILVDDGIATGSSMLAAIQAVRHAQPSRIIVAVPVAPADVCRILESEVDQVICLRTPQPFYAVGLWYEDFHQITDDEATHLLDEAHREEAQRKQDRDTGNK